MQAIDVALSIYHIKDMKRPINHPNGHDLHALPRQMWAMK